MSVLYLFHGRRHDDPDGLVGIVLYGRRGHEPLAKAREIGGPDVVWHACHVVDPISGDRHNVILTEAEMQARAIAVSKQRQRRRHQRRHLLLEREADGGVDFNRAKRGLRW